MVRRILTLLAVVHLSVLGLHAQDRIQLKSGFVINGRGRNYKLLSMDPSAAGESTGSYKMIDQKYKSYFVPNRSIGAKMADSIYLQESFELKHRSTGRASVPDYIGSFSSATPFDANGVRRVTLRTQRGTETIIQAVEKLTPKYVWIKSLTHKWEYGMATSNLPSDVLIKMLRSASDEEDPLDQYSICSFLIQAQRPDLARVMLDEVTNRFPDYKKQADSSNTMLYQLFARRVLDELTDRRDAGQHEVVKGALSRFDRKSLPAETLAEIDQLQKEYTAKQTAVDLIGQHMEQLESKIDEKLQAKVKPMREQMTAKLSISSLDRLDAYMTLAKDKSFKPEQLLSMAYSGWMLGASNATTNLPETIGLWSAREHLAEYFGTDDQIARTRVVDELKRLEGVTPQRLASLLSVSPPRPQFNARPGEIVDFTARTPGGGSANYKAVLPPGYSEYHEYPMIVALRQENITQEDALIWWAGTAARPLQAQRHGYIVIAPQYIPTGTTYESDAQSHTIVLASLRDALRRFSADPDRVFLTGHGAGGNATFEIAMAHPDVFAGAIPIVGMVTPVCSKLTGNGKLIPWYVVSGQRHRAALQHNEFVLDQIRRKGGHLIVCEYKNRGFEDYYEEIHNLFEWMSLQRREDMPSRTKVQVVRPEDGGFYWIEATEFSDWLSDQDYSGKPKTRIRSVDLELSAKSTSKVNSVRIKSGTAKQITLRFIEGVIDFGKPVSVSRYSGRRLKVDPEPSVKDVLADFERHYDRSRIALQRVVLP